jgi:ABC-type molybdate transport system substrate-binding protein
MKRITLILLMTCLLLGIYIITSSGSKQPSSVNKIQLFASGGLMQILEYSDDLNMQWYVIYKKLY